MLLLANFLMTNQFMIVYGTSYLYAQENLIDKANQLHTFFNMTEICKQCNEIARSVAI